VLPLEALSRRPIQFNEIDATRTVASLKVDDHSPECSEEPSAPPAFDICRQIDFLVLDWR